MRIVGASVAPRVSRSHLTTGPGMSARKESVSTKDETLRNLVGRFAQSERGATLRRRIDAHDLGQLSVPDSRACRDAESVCREVSSEALANHCFRSYAWGVLLGTADGTAWDAELLYTAAMLHDIGLTPAYDRGGCFESDGAEAAREILDTVGWPAERCEIVADAIYLHMHDVTADHSGEAQLLALGTTADVSGGRALEIETAARSLILELFPREGFKTEMVGLFEDQARRKPQCVVQQYMQGGLGARMMAAPYDD
jgi:hypothetical protein